MVLHHVAQRAGIVVVTPAPFESDGFRDGDLHVVDGRCVPQRLEQRVREPQREQVLHRLFSEVVIDAEDAVFVEDTAHGLVDLDARRIVLADGLLEHDAAELAGETRGGKAQAGRPVELRRRRHEIENAVVARERLLQRLGALRAAVTGLERRVSDARQQVGQRVFLEVFGGHVLAQRAFDDLAEFVVGHRMARGADKGERRRHELFAAQVVQRRPHHALGEIAGRAEQHEFLDRLFHELSSSRAAPSSSTCGWEMVSTGIAAHRRA